MARRRVGQTCSLDRGVGYVNLKILILAGGRSSRFGSDKALALLHGRPLIAHVMDHFAGRPVAISGGAHFARFGVPVLPDGEFAGAGPLAGIYEGLEWALDAEALITVPCDTPFLPQDLIPRLFPGPCYVRAGGREHFLVASWPPDSRAILQSLMQDGGSRKVERFTRALDAQAVDFADDGRLLLNINRPEELENAARQGCGSIIPQ